MVVNYHDGGGNDPYRPDFTRVSVEPADLAEFADMLDHDIDALLETWDRLIDDLGLPSGPDEPTTAAYPNFRGEPGDGTGGLTEGAAFGKAYTGTFFAKLLLMRDLVRGLQILRDTAREIHESYVRTDAANASDVKNPFAAYEQWQVIEALRNQVDPQEPAA